ncbi:MAG TPA: hypothetical protein VEA80_09960 [Vitreimonas sp.]|uniref:hypothetical protein n=1 Tax=Vitreimonas sp. TaxID=3069702 RepID=UPI002D6E7E0C|nr:hypothetical protein [Vitreimonas sp.]HYD87789.1 hypothetical protein [Vitreimonas sp.]
MRAAGLALVSALALAACNQAGPGQSADSGGVFPDLTRAAYRAEATITHDAGAMPVVMIRDGQRQRVEMTTPAGATTMIMNSQTGEAYVITNAGGQTVAMRMDAGQFEDPAKEWSAEVSSTARRTGSCSVAGENGAEWTRDQDGTPHTVCVTNDGIILRAREGERTVWETTSVQRGPQSAEQFTLPAGVEVMDLGNLEQQMRQAMERAQGGQ